MDSRRVTVQTDKNLERAVGLFRALADETRSNSLAAWLKAHSS